MNDAVSPVDPPPLKFRTKFFYGIGSMAYGVKDVAFRVYLLWFYNYVIGAPAALVSLAILVALVVDALSDPIVGQISDGLRTKWGRRHPLMYASAVPAALSFYLLWHPPAGLEGWSLFLYLALLSSLVRSFITLYEIPSSALAPELSTNYDDRTAIASYRYFFGYLGGIGMSVLALWIWLAPTEAYPIGQLNPEGYLTFGLVGSLLMITTVLISTAGTHHRIKYLRRLPPPERRGPAETLGLMVRTFGSKPFLAILGFGVLKYTAIGLASALALYFGTLFWGFNSRELALMAADPLVGALLALVFAPLISRKLGKRNAALVLSVVAVVFGVAPFVLRLTGLFFENGDPLLLPVLFSILSVYSACGISSGDPGPRHDRGRDRRERPAHRPACRGAVLCRQQLHAEMRHRLRPDGGRYPAHRGQSAGKGPSRGRRSGLGGPARPALPSQCGPALPRRCRFPPLLPDRSGEPRGQSRGIAGPGGGRGYGWRSGLGIPVHAGSPRWRIVSQQPVSRCQPERAAL